MGVQSYLKMLMMDNFIHADLHPGNVLVRPPLHTHLARMAAMMNNLFFVLIADDLRMKTRISHETELLPPLPRPVITWSPPCSRVCVCDARAMCVCRCAWRRQT